MLFGGGGGGGGGSIFSLKFGLFSSPEQKVPGEPIGKAVVCRRHLHWRQHFQRITPLKPLGQLKQNYMLVT